MATNEEEIWIQRLGTQTLKPNPITAGEQTVGKNKSYTGEGKKNSKPVSGHVSYPQRVS